MNKMLMTIAIIALVAGIVLVVFSVINSPASMLAMTISGIVLMVMALIYMVVYARSKKKEK